AELEAVARRFVLALEGTPALDDHTLAWAVRLSSKKDATNVSPEESDAEGAVGGDSSLALEDETSLADELAERFAVAPEKIERLAGFARDPDDFLVRLSCIRAGAAASTGDRILETLARLERKHFQFDDRFRILDGLFAG